MSATRAERLREAVSEKLGEAEGRYRDLDPLMTSEEMLAAVVEELGITREMAAHYVMDPCPTCARTRDIFTALLDAAGVP